VLARQVAKDESTPEAAAAAAVPKDAEDEADEADRQTRLNEVIARLEEIDAHTAPGRAGTILSGLGFSSEMQARNHHATTAA
jgi:ATP-binding cassette subfamily F protein 3